MFEKISDHGGNIRKYAQSSGKAELEIIDFSSNVNPCGPPSWLRSVISANLSRVSSYPDPSANLFRNAVAKAHGIGVETVIAGNGASELIHAIPQTFALKRALIPAPAYTDYERACLLANIPVKCLESRADNNFAIDEDRLSGEVKDGDMLFLGRPQNPTGHTMSADSLRTIARKNQNALFVVDESFGGFVDGFESLIYSRPENVIVVVSLTKLFSIPGLRIGFAIADNNLAEKIRERLPLWTVNSLAQVVGAEAIKDTEYVERSRRLAAQWKVSLLRSLEKIEGLTTFPGEANYILAHLENGDSTDLFNFAISKGFAIRLCGNFTGLDDSYFRIAVRTEDENIALVDVLKAGIEKRNVSASVKVASKTPAIMLQGTGSGAGKSLLTAALCRIFKQDGYSVAPFKAQNMSLNSYSTLDGKEIARAQVTQATACGIETDIRMNPVLLKPTGDTGSQVIIRGEPYKNMTVREYFRFKKEAFEIVKEDYDSLAKEYDIMALEGAGSPAEVNLKANDIVNMRMARHAGARVLLAGDIDRGGVFASFIGVMETLEEWERAMVSGFLINKFRGDKSLLDTALDYTFRHTGKPTLGVIPYIRNLSLPEEDSAGLDTRHDAQKKPKAVIDLAFIRLRHISNFNDIDPFYLEPDVSARLVGSVAELGSPDVIIIPGSKSVISDLRLLKDSGLAGAIHEYAKSGKGEVVGICGGFQMLGNKTLDPDKIESTTGEASGLSLLPMTTTIHPRKIVRRVEAKHMVSGHTLHGYEIHHGTSDGDSLSACVAGRDGGLLGYSHPDKNVWGTYLHGLFDADIFRRWFIDRARERKGLDPLGSVQAVYDMESSLDKLADTVRGNMDIDAVYRLLGMK